MENVTCTIDIELTDNENVFGGDWDFTIGIYQFQKLSEDIVRVIFMYEDEVSRQEEDGTIVTGHDPWSDRYVEAEENLQILLDIISFQTSGIGLRILPDSLEMRSSSMITHRSEQQHLILLKDHDEIEIRYERTVSDRNEKLLDALRLSRLAANEENEGEKIGQLWGAVERLYASDAPRVLDTKEKRKEIKELIDQAALISNADKKRLKNNVINTYKMSKPSVIAEKFGLIGGDGEMRTIDDVKKELDYWIGTRSIQSHGEILMRNRDVNMLAGSMGHIMETALSGEVKPSKYVYFVYKADNVERSFLSSQRAATKKDTGSGYCYTALHKFAAFRDMPDRLRHSLLEENSELYLVEFRSITLIKRSGDEDVALEDLQNEELSRLIQELQNMLN